MLAAPMAADLGVATPTVFAAFSGAMVVSALVGPWAGLAIDRHGGRVVLAGTSLVFALGLGMLGFAQGLWTMVIAWLVIGAAMGAGLYEAAFSSLVRLYGQHARGAITGITLLAGFASTVGWPLSAWMETRFGWRNACLGWAGIHLLIGLPLNAWLPTLPSPAQPERTAAADPAQAIASASPPPVAAAGGRIRDRPARLRVRRNLVHQHRDGHAFAADAGGCRRHARRRGRRGRPRRSRAGGRPRAGVRVSAARPPVAVGAPGRAGTPRRRDRAVDGGAGGGPLFAILHGAGNGILTIAKGTLPLALFGAQGYGARQGWLMLPARIAQALAPLLFGLALDAWGPTLCGCPAPSAWQPVAR
ncbi:MFS transporter [Achromobacter xylosoxidans]